MAYRRCEDHGFLFPADFDHWPSACFASEIHIKGHFLVDPEYREARPRRLAGMVAHALAAARPHIRLLDHGGGEGLTAAPLGKAGFDVIGWGPFVPGGSPPDRPFDVITSFEGMDHAPDPASVVAAIAARLKPGGSPT